MKNEFLYTEFIRSVTLIFFVPEPLIGGNQKHYGFEASLSQRVWKIELFADVFIGINKIDYQGTGLLDPKVVFRSHMKLQLGIGITFGMK